jgi:type I restriction enzyme R subunit
VYNRYKHIFKYFDGIRVGLTATPKSETDKDTYGLFNMQPGNPTYAYELEQAVNDRFLVPPKGIYVPLKFQRQGIKYAELSDEDKLAYEEQFTDPLTGEYPDEIEATALNKWLFNTDTVDKVIAHFMEFGIKVEGGDKLAKTMIFARSHKHAKFIEDRFNIQYPAYKGDFLKVIDYQEEYKYDLLNKFKDKQKMPQIAVSVDMLDTGIDVPEVCNLVFFKPVRSSTKFWQMIGRGSRLRPNLFGEDQDKKNFLIFDLYGNFEFFRENPNGIETGSQKSLIEIVFGLKLQLALYLKEDNFKNDKELQEHSERLLDELHNSIIELNKERFDVKMKIETVMNFSNREVWNHLDKKECKTILDVLAPLVRPSKADSDTARFYDKMIYMLMIKRIETPDTEEFLATLNTPITKVAIISKKLLKKTTIPEIKHNEEIVKLPLNEDFWKNNGLNHLEKIRAGIRELVKYLDPVDQRYVTTNFEDAILESEIITSAFGEEKPESYANPFANNTHRLEEIIRENKNNITIARIQNGEPSHSRFCEIVQSFHSLQDNPVYSFCE